VKNQNQLYPIKTLEDAPAAIINPSKFSQPIY
jgi:hypothetical protein